MNKSEQMLQGYASNTNYSIAKLIYQGWLKLN